MQPEDAASGHLTVYGIANCDKIRKTIAWFKDQGVAVDLHDYRRQGIGEDLLDALQQRFTDAELINSRGSTWRAIADHEKTGPTAPGARELMRKYPAILKRPIIHADGQWIIGYDTSLFQKMANSMQQTKV